MTLSLGTLIGQTLTFIVFVYFCRKFIWPPLINAMRERQEAIAAGLSSAERAEKDLELAQERVAEQLREAAEVHEEKALDAAFDRLLGGADSGGT